MRNKLNMTLIPEIRADTNGNSAEPERFARSLIQFCGLEWEDQCLRFHESKRVVHTCSYDQVRQPIYSDSVQRWKHYERYLGPLKRGLGVEG